MLLISENPLTCLLFYFCTKFDKAGSRKNGVYFHRLLKVMVKAGARVSISACPGFPEKLLKQVSDQCSIPAPAPRG